MTRAFAVVVHEDYVQHNPAIPDGRDAAVAALAPTFADPDFHADIQRILVDGDHSASNSAWRRCRSGGSGGTAADEHIATAGTVASLGFDRMWHRPLCELDGVSGRADQ